MSTHDESRLARGLHRRADEVGGHPVSLEDVQRSARGIRRRRRVAGGIAAVAMVAVAVPATITAITAGGGRSDRPAPIASPSHPVPSTTSTASTASTGSATPLPSATSAPSAPSAEPSAAPLTTHGSGPSGPPAVDYLSGVTLHRVDGSTVHLPGTYNELTPYHGGYLATELGDQGFEVVTLDNTGKEVDRRPGDFRIAVGANGTTVSWLTLDGARPVLHRAIASGSSDVVDDVPVRSSAATGPIGFVDAEQVVYEVPGEAPEVRLADFADRSDRRLTGLIGVGGTSPSEPLVSGQLSSQDDGSCWAVRRVTDGHDLWRTCDFSLGRFSPDGRLVVGYSAYRDGAGDSELAVLDAHTGRVLAHWKSTRRSQAIAQRVTWENDDTLLATVFQAGAWSMMRLGDDGELTTALGPEQGDLDRSPWSFVAGP
jgi:hypothetical protein